MTVEVVDGAGRRRNLLGRYLRLEYSDLVAELADLDLPDDELRVLTALYSGAATEDLAGVVLTGADGIGPLVEGLEGKQLITQTDGGIELTSLGRMAVSERVEAVNA